MLVKVHKSYREIIAVCDSYLLGKKFEEDIFQLEVKENFFNGEKVSKQELLGILQNFSKEDATFNFIGEKSINCAIQSGLVTEEGVKKIKNIPFAMVLL